MKKYYLLLFLMLLIVFPFFVEAQRGCCSHHGGVYGCHKSGRTLCMDGTLSPTCTCVVSSKYTYGCTDPDAKNYNANANKDNGMCIYYEYGCTDSDAINYDYYAEIDDGSCEYKKKEEKSWVVMFISSMIYFLVGIIFCFVYSKYKEYIWTLLLLIKDLVVVFLVCLFGYFLFVVNDENYIEKQRIKKEEELKQEEKECIAEGKYPYRFHCSDVLDIACHVSCQSKASK